MRAFSGTVAPAQYFRKVIGGTLPRHSVPRVVGDGLFSLNPSAGSTARFDRLAGRKCDVNAFRAPQVATSTHFGHPFRSENEMSTYIGHPGMRPQRISDTPAGLAERRIGALGALGRHLVISLLIFHEGNRRIGALGALGLSIAHFLINNLVRKEENWCLGRPGALIWSFPH